MAAEGLVGIDVVTQERDVAVQSLQIPPGLFIDPALGGVDFAVLLVMAVLGTMNSGRRAMACFCPGATITGVIALW